jgi:hypothetical protein
MSDRFNAYKTALDSKWLTINDVREREGMPPLTPEPTNVEASNE